MSRWAVLTLCVMNVLLLRALLSTVYVRWQLIVCTDGRVVDSFGWMCRWCILLMKLLPSTVRKCCLTSVRSAVCELGISVSPSMCYGRCLVGLCRRVESGCLASLTILSVWLTCRGLPGRTCVVVIGLSVVKCLRRVV